MQIDRRRHPLPLIVTMLMLATTALAVDEDRSGASAAVKRSEIATAAVTPAIAMLRAAAAYRENNREAAIAWWRQAAAGGIDDAAFNAGLVLQQNGASDAAIALLEPIADTRDPDACFVLGLAYLERADNGDSAQATAAFECAAQSGDAPAQFNLARLLLQADTLPAAAAVAREWLSQAAPNFAPAQDLLESIDRQPPDPSVRAEPDVYTTPWVLAQDPQKYTLQVAAGRTEAAIRTLLARHPSGHDAAWFLHRPRSGEPYSAVIGAWAEFSDAESALATLPAVFRSNAPWIRRFANLQRELSGLSDTLNNAPE